MKNNCDQVKFYKLSEVNMSERSPDLFTMFVSCSFMVLSEGQDKINRNFRVNQFITNHEMSQKLRCWFMGFFWNCLYFPCIIDVSRKFLYSSHIHNSTSGV